MATGFPLASVKLCPSSEEPTVRPLAVTSDPLAWWEKATSPTPVRTRE